MLTRPRALAVAASALALAAAGCGGGGNGGEAGGDRLTKEEYIAAADAICAEADEALEELGDPDPTDLEAFITEAETIARDQLERLRALRPPAEDEARLEEAYGLIEQQIERAVEAGRAVQEGDLVRAQELGAEIDDLNAQADEIAREYGLKECGSDD